MKMSGSLLLRAAERVDVRDSTPVVVVAVDDFSELIAVTADVTNPSVQQVTFVITKGDKWVRLANDDASPYRAFINPKALVDGETTYVAAIIRNASGKAVISNIVKVPA